MADGSFSFEALGAVRLVEDTTERHIGTKVIAVIISYFVRVVEVGE